MVSPVQARALLQQRPAKGWEDAISFLHSRYLLTSMSVLKNSKNRPERGQQLLLAAFRYHRDEIELTMNSLIVRMGPQHFSVSGIRQEKVSEFHP